MNGCHQEEAKLIKPPPAAPPEPKLWAVGEPTAEGRAGAESPGLRRSERCAAGKGARRSEPRPAVPFLAARPVQRPLGQAKCSRAAARHGTQEEAKLIKCASVLDPNWRCENRKNIPGWTCPFDHTPAPVSAVEGDPPPYRRGRPLSSPRPMKSGPRGCATPWMSESAECAPEGAPSPP
jgi:hypothetical protein